MKNFKFIGIKDCGSTSCPHCGSDGRYIYIWEKDGLRKSAMAGCYKMLTGKLDKGEDIRYFELLSEKQAKGKDLNGWDKNIIRLLGYKDSGKYSDIWIDQKISDILRERKNYLSKKRF